MTQFSSRPPFNDDPEPFIQYVDHRVHDPRPEFDRPQHNPTNPILVEFRDADAGRIVKVYPTTASLAAYWVESLASAASSLGWNATLAHIDHARRVLARLARLTEKENA